MSDPVEVHPEPEAEEPVAADTAETADTGTAETTEAAEPTEQADTPDTPDIIETAETVETSDTTDTTDADATDAPDDAATTQDSAGHDLVEEGDVAADYLEGLLDIVDLDGDIDITVENGRAAVSVIEVNRGDLGDLVGEDASVLRALQDLTRLAVARETGHRSRLTLDIAGHRASRRAELQRLAKSAIEDARSSGAPVRMAAMTAFERKVVHDEVAAAGMTSESEGEDPNRSVVITPA